MSGSLDPFDSRLPSKDAKPLVAVNVTEHCNNSFKAMYQMQVDNVLCDVNILIPGDGVTVKEEIVPVHKVVLSCSSNYFRALFTNQMVESNSGTVVLPGVRSAAVFKMLIEYLYTGRVMATQLYSNISTSPTIAPVTPPATQSLVRVDEVADSILYLLELADLYTIEPLFLACTSYLRQRICVANCVSWLQFMSRLPNSNELYQSCLAFFCSHLHQFTPLVVVPFDFKLFESVVSSECLRVDNELQVFHLTALWLLAEDTDSVFSDRIEKYGANLLSHIRFGRIPLIDLESWFTHRHLDMAPEVRENLRASFRLPADVLSDDADDDDLMCSNDAPDAMLEDKDLELAAPEICDEVPPTYNIEKIKSIFTACCHALLEQLSTPQLDADMLSTSGWVNTRFYPISLYDRQAATVFKQGVDEGMVRAIVLSPDNSMIFTGSATTSSAELMSLPPSYHANSGGPEPCLKVWKQPAVVASASGSSATSNNWQCVQSVPCGEDIVALAIQEYPVDIYYAMQVQHARTLFAASGGIGEPPVLQLAATAAFPNNPENPPVTSPFTSLFQSVISILHNNNDNVMAPTDMPAVASTMDPPEQVKEQSLPSLPKFQLISAQLGRPSHHHTPKLRLRCWQYHPIEDIWRPVKEIALVTAFVKNPVLFVIDNTRLLVGNYRTVQIWNTRTWTKDHEWAMDATLRAFVVCSCGRELIGRSVRDIRAWNMNGWQMVRAMPAKLGGNHKAKLASCLAIHRNSILFPMRDCIVSCDPHTGARLQRFPLPPFAPTFDDLPVTAPSIISKFELASPNVIPQAALSDPEAWIMSSFLLSGDMLFVATYHGWLGIFSLSYETASNSSSDQTVPAEENSELHLKCERYWQTAGASVEKGAVVNSLAVVMQLSGEKDKMDTSDNVVSKEAEDAVAGVITVLDYGNSLVLWRKY